MADDAAGLGSPDVTDRTVRAGAGSDAGRWRAGALYLGGLLGPFGGTLVSPMQPELRASFHASKSAAAASLTVYFIPFAVLLFVSGTLGERWGRRRVVRSAYLVYAVACLAAAAAPTLRLFLLSRGAQGCANAFTTPLVLAGLADLAPPERLGRSVGIFASCQAAGQSLGPFVGGVAADVNWRWAFVGVAIAALALTAAPPPGEARRGGVSPPWRPLLSTRMVLLALAGFCIGSGVVGLGFLVAERGRDHLGLSASRAGLVLVGFGLAGLVSGSLWGRLTDRVDPRRSGLAAAVVASGLVATAGWARPAALLAVCWAAAGAASSLLTVSVQRLTVSAVPANRGGAVSAASAFRFIGAAAAPAMWLPLYDRHVATAFLTAGGCGLVAGAALTAIRAPVPAPTAVTGVTASG